MECWTPSSPRKNGLVLVKRTEGLFSRRELIVFQKLCFQFFFFFFCFAILPRNPRAGINTISVKERAVKETEGTYGNKLTKRINMNKLPGRKPGAGCEIRTRRVCVPIQTPPDRGWTLSSPRIKGLVSRRDPRGPKGGYFQKIRVSFFVFFDGVSVAITVTEH